MVEIGGKPLLWHIMKLYAAHGCSDFVCCLGYRGDVIKHYFLDYHALRSDVTVSLAQGAVEYASGEVEDWRVSLIDTGQDSMTGARVKRVEHQIDHADLFMCTYGDGLADIDITRLLDFHRSHGRLATVAGVRPPSRFGELVTDGGLVSRFAEKPQGGSRISGGFFVFQREVLDRLSADPGCVLEREPLERLALDNELCVYPHDGFWQCADTIRDVELLRSLWDRGDAPWRVWEGRGPAGAPDGRGPASAADHRGPAGPPPSHPMRRTADAVEALIGSMPGE